VIKLEQTEHETNDKRLLFTFTEKELYIVEKPLDSILFLEPSSNIYINKCILSVKDKKIIILYYSFPHRKGWTISST